MQLRVHFLQSRSKRLNLLLQALNGRALLLSRFVLFKKLVEQHRVHRFVAHCVGLSLLVTGHQIGIHLFHVLGYQPELWDALGSSSCL